MCYHRSAAPADRSPVVPTAEECVLPYSWMLWSALAFAVMGAFTHAARDYCDWQVVALARSSLALIIAGALAYRSGTTLVYFRPATLWMRSISGSISVMCNFYALTHMPVADALTLTNMFPVWIAVLSWPLLGHVPELGVWLAVISGVAGVAVMQQSELSDTSLTTIIAVVGSLTSAVALIGLHRLKDISSTAIVVHFSAVSILFLLASLFFVDDGRTYAEQFAMEWPAPVLLVGVGVSATVGQLLMTKAFGAGAPAKVAVVGLTQVGFAMIFDVVLWHRSFNIYTLVGMALVTIPSAWLLLRQRAVREELQ